MENISQNPERRIHTLAGQAESFINNLRQRKLSPRTLESRDRALKRFISFLDGAEIERFQDVSLTILERYRLILREAQCTDNTIENYLQAVRQLFDFMEKRGELFENPARYFELHRKSETIPDVLTEAEVTKLLSMPDCTISWGFRDRALMEVLYSCGLRREELLALTIFDVDFDRETLRVIGKGRKERIVPVGNHACRYLKQYIKEVRPHMINHHMANNDALWWSIFHKPLGLQMPPKLIAGYAKKAGIERRVSTHTLRRTCATHLLQHGAHPLMVAELLGHSDLSVLRKYLKITTADLFKTHKKTKPGR